MKHDTEQQTPVEAAIQLEESVPADPRPPLPSTEELMPYYLLSMVGAY